MTHLQSDKASEVAAFNESDHQCLVSDEIIEY